MAVGLFFFLTTHTQIIVGAIQNLSQGVVNTKNLYEPLRAPLQETKDNGQFIITEIRYSEVYPNSFLDITYPDATVDTERPTLIYFHGGGFFGGSKCDGDPLAEGDATALLDDICAEGFNLVNIDYALVPEYHFPSPVIQANEAFRFLIDHAEEYHLDMDNIVIMGSSAGAIIFPCGAYGKIGSNLNQIARYLNEYGAPYTALSNEVRAAVSDLDALKFEMLKVIGEAYGNDQAYQL